MADAEDLGRHVPDGIRQHFVAAYKGRYGYWFEFDGTLAFRDGDGTLPFAYGKTLDECRRMMENHENAKHSSRGGQ